MAFDLAKGSLLVATPALTDPNFARSVVLVCDHGEEGTMGLIINRPLDIQLADILPEEFTLPPGMPRVHQGGPVQQDHLLFLHGIPSPGLDAHPVCEGVFLGGDPEILKQALAGAQKPPFLKCYLGYAGWGAGQLEAEMEEGAWLVRPAKVQDVFGIDLGSLWTRLIGAQAGTRINPFGPPRGHDLN